MEVSQISIDIIELEVVRSSTQSLIVCFKPRCKQAALEWRLVRPFMLTIVEAADTKRVHGSVVVLATSKQGTRVYIEWTDTRTKYGRSRKLCLWLDVNRALNQCNRFAVRSGEGGIRRKLWA